MAEASRFITLTTDFGLQDGFVGMMKGVIYGINPDAVVIDITHEVGPQDVMEATLLLGTAYRYFPAGTIHLVVVDPGVGSQRRAIAVETARYYFVAPDNGVLTYALARENVVKAVEVTNPAYFLSEISNTFHGRDIFAPAAAHISLGVKIEAMGSEVDDLIKFSLPEPEVHQKAIKGHIIHIDKFGNLITNIPLELFKSAVSGRKFLIEFAGIRLDRISYSYTEVLPGKPLAIFDSFGNLEIAINRGHAAQALGADKGDGIEIIFS